MARSLLSPSLLVAAGLLLGSLAAPSAQASEDEGFTRPLERLQFNSRLDPREFERATLNSLNVYDPWESWNRYIYHFNYRFDQWVFLPVVDGYRRVTPRFVRSGVSNFFGNLGDFGSLFNSLLQLKGQRSMELTARLLFNNTFGVFGLWDPARRMGLPRQSEDFGQTLGHYGVGAGPYLVLPFLGPSNLRDAGGKLVDFGLEQSLDLYNQATTSSRHPELTLLRGVDLRYTTPYRYGQLNSPFEYEKVRYIYQQGRQLVIDD